MTVRRPAVAGRFYENDPDRLREQVAATFTHRLGPGSVPTAANGPPDQLGLVSPHAGLPYSGPVAAHGMAALAASGRPDVLIIVGPNHTGAGEPLAVSEADQWRTPLGTVDVHEGIRERLLAESAHAVLDEAAHRREHAIEVQVPFAQVVYEDPPAIVPVVMGRQTRAMASDLGASIENAVAESVETVVAIASTDLTHYEPQSVAEAADETVIERIEALDADGLFDVIERDAISMCGYGPTAAVMTAATDLGADRGACLQYATSGDVTGSTEDVVGYCSATLS
ncbi:putative class III extradiol dioxygenase, MEMO1family [Halanaeroarchaeum sp. HSR-CO]|uniref:AmmeMemoRadiSam system protein B n=1 Tax=Halanaeroarchaeum sp. HSR-CO TaxID=2866382 RepID=UPI00217E514F|nr:AmmeMemoRadiSam system protein B [Halanaeroarchaeum sp. HSR-CO]UWG47770.1 putative class III extradiol dioxygenase, MEMO1family [Halanaeroarchaeum sp. HSR-CO]